MPECGGNWTLAVAVLSLGLTSCSDDASLGSNDLFDETSDSGSSNAGGMSSSSNTNATSSSSTTDASGSTESASSGVGGSDVGAASSGDDGVTGSSSTTDGTGGSGGDASASSTSGSGGVAGSGTTDVGSTGTGGGETSTSTTGFECETDNLCVRPYECAVSCDVEPVYVGCCPCEEGLIDQFVECRGVECGGTTCAMDEYCARPVGQCDAPSESGSCAWRPEGCTADYAPVCGCDGQTYSNDCMAAGAGVNIAEEGECDSGA